MFTGDVSDASVIQHCQHRRRMSAPNTGGAAAEMPLAKATAARAPTPALRQAPTGAETLKSIGVPGALVDGRLERLWNIVSLLINIHSADPHSLDGSHSNSKPNHAAKICKVFKSI